VQVVAPGTAGNVLTSNGTTWQSTAPAPSAGSITATASGAITAGNPVVVNSNGTVSAVSGTPGTNPTVGSTANTVNGCGYTQAASWFDPSTNVIVWVYRNNSDGYLYSAAGTVSGSTATWGTAQVIHSATVVDGQISITGENNGTIVVSWESGGYAWYTVGTTTSGSTSVSWSSPNYTNGYSGQSQIRVTYLSSINRYLFVFSDDSGVYASGGYMVAYLMQRPTGAGYLNYVTYQVVFGARYYFQGAQSLAGFGNTAVVAFQDNQNNNIAAFAITATASSISYGSPVNPGSSASGNYRTAVVYYPADSRWLIFYVSSSALRLAAASVSGTSLSFGTSIQVANDSQAAQLSPSYSSTYQRVLLAWYYVGTWPSGTVVASSGGTVSAGSLSFLSGTSGANGMACVNNGATFFVNWARTGSPYTGVYAPVSIAFNTNLTSTNFVGFSQATYANGATATVNVVGGVNTGQSGLTAGLQYYLVGNGTLATTASSPTVYTGVATSATNILVKG
jgi:hypothetical protein